MTDKLIYKALYIIMKCVLINLSGEDFKRMVEATKEWKKEVEDKTACEL